MIKRCSKKQPDYQHWTEKQGWQCKIERKSLSELSNFCAVYTEVPTCCISSKQNRSNKTRQNKSNANIISHVWPGPANLIREARSRWRLHDCKETKI